jgi:hypothetical protein
MTFDGTSLIRYFGHDCSVTISPEVEIILAGSFSWCATIRSFEFESKSRVRCIGVRAFEHCAQLDQLRNTSLGESSFRKCNNLQEFRIEGGARLRRIEANAFHGCTSLQTIFLPRPVDGREELDLASVRSGLEIV